MDMSITEICRHLRRNSTPAENAFWLVVRNRQIKGYKFNRQHPIVFEYDDERRFFVADFYCHELRLVIEIDGGIHETQKDYDALRTEIISELGMHVLRFTNTDVLGKIDVVVKGLESVMDQLTPVPSLGKEG